MTDEMILLDFLSLCCNFIQNIRKFLFSNNSFAPYLAGITLFNFSIHGLRHPGKHIRSLSVLCSVYNENHENRQSNLSIRTIQSFKSSMLFSMSFLWAISITW